jgi:hypothetical protein
MIPEENSLRSVRDAIKSWEKLRITFNLLLLALGLLLSWDLYPAFGGMDGYVFWAVIYGVTVNAFYCLGPLSEIYLLTLVPGRMPQNRLLVFVAGTLFSLVVTAVIAFGTRWTFELRGWV